MTGTGASGGPRAERCRTYTARLDVLGSVVDVTFNPRCSICNKVFAHYQAHPYAIDCPRCGQLNQAGLPLAPVAPVAPATTE